MQTFHQLALIYHSPLCSTSTSKPPSGSPHQPLHWTLCLSTHTLPFLQGLPQCFLMFGILNNPSQHLMHFLSPYRPSSSYRGCTMQSNFVDICVQHLWWNDSLPEGRDHLSLFLCSLSLFSTRAVSILVLLFSKTNAYTHYTILTYNNIGFYTPAR